MSTYTVGKVSSKLPQWPPPAPQQDTARDPASSAKKPDTACSSRMIAKVISQYRHAFEKLLTGPEDGSHSKPVATLPTGAAPASMLRPALMDSAAFGNFGVCVTELQFYLQLLQTSVSGKTLDMGEKVGSLDAASEARPNAAPAPPGPRASGAKDVAARIKEMNDASSQQPPKTPPPTTPQPRSSSSHAIRNAPTTVPPAVDHAITPAAAMDHLPSSTTPAAEHSAAGSAAVAAADDGHLVHHSINETAGETADEIEVNYGGSSEGKGGEGEGEDGERDYAADVVAMCDFIQAQLANLFAENKQLAGRARSHTLPPGLQMVAEGPGGGGGGNNSSAVHGKGNDGLLAPAAAGGGVDAHTAAKALAVMTRRRAASALLVSAGSDSGQQQPPLLHQGAGDGSITDSAGTTAINNPIFVGLFGPAAGGSGSGGASAMSAGTNAVSDIEDGAGSSCCGDSAAGGDGESDAGWWCGGGGGIGGGGKEGLHGDASSIGDSSSTPGSRMASFLTTRFRSDLSLVSGPVSPTHGHGNQQYQPFKPSKLGAAALLAPQQQEEVGEQQMEEQQQYDSPETAVMDGGGAAFAAEDHQEEQQVYGSLKASTDVGMGDAFIAVAEDPIPISGFVRAVVTAHGSAADALPQDASPNVTLPQAASSEQKKTVNSVTSVTTHGNRVEAAVQPAQRAKANVAQGAAVPKMPVICPSEEDAKEQTRLAAKAVKVVKVVTADAGKSMSDSSFAAAGATESNVTITGSDGRSKGRSPATVHVAVQRSGGGGGSGGSKVSVRVIVGTTAGGGDRKAAPPAVAVAGFAGLTAARLVHGGKTAIAISNGGAGSGAAVRGSGGSGAAVRNIGGSGAGARSGTGLEEVWRELLKLKAILDTSNPLEMFSASATSGPAAAAGVTAV